jgi:hypothetical protein
MTSKKAPYNGAFLPCRRSHAVAGRRRPPSTGLRTRLLEPNRARGNIRRPVGVISDAIGRNSDDVTCRLAHATSCSSAASEPQTTGAPPGGLKPILTRVDTCRLPSYTQEAREQFGGREIKLHNLSLRRQRSHVRILSGAPDHPRARCRTTSGARISSTRCGTLSRLRSGLNLFGRTRAGPPEQSA